MTAWITSSRARLAPGPREDAVAIVTPVAARASVAVRLSVNVLRILMFRSCLGVMVPTSCVDDRPRRFLRGCKTATSARVARRRRVVRRCAYPVRRCYGLAEGNLDFRILGPLEVSRDGRPVVFGGRRPRALLCVLLLRANEVVSTDRLVEDLWAGAPPARARKALQVYVSRLRRALGDGVLETSSPGYVLRVGDGELDLWRCERLSAEGTQALALGNASRAGVALRDALGMWRGAALADVVYEPFAQAEVGRLEELRLRCLEDAIEAELALGRHAGLVAELEALTAVHRSRERLRGALMLALYRSGRQADALAAYRDGRRLLVDELGIEPGPELRSLESAILAQDPRLTWTARGTNADAAIAVAGDFVGRDRELTELVGAVREARRGCGSVLLLTGEAGIGKTRLAEEAAARARANGARVVCGHCWEAGGAPPYWPWLQCLRALARARDPAALIAQLGDAATDIAAIVPEFRELWHGAPRPPADGPEGARFRLFESVAALLRNASAAEPLVLVLEDLQAADSSSLLLLQFVARELADARVVIIATRRDTADRAVAAAFAGTLTELSRTGRFRHLALGGLERADVARLVQTAGGDAGGGGLVSEIYGRTDGHPLFVGE